MKPLRQWIAPLFAFIFPMTGMAAHDDLKASVDETGTRLVLLDGLDEVMPPVNSRGYNVVTWDPRGEFASGGTLDLDWDPDSGQSFQDFIAFIVPSSEDNELMPPGSQIWMTMSLISGPEGSDFALWEPDTDEPAHLFPADGSGGGFDFVLSEWDSGVADAAQDPEGHIDGRVFTGSLPGDYYVQFRLYDAQGLLDPSVDYTFHFVAVPEPGSLSLGLIAFTLLGWRRRKRGWRPLSVSKNKRAIS